MILATALLAFQATAYKVQPIFPPSNLQWECITVNDKSQVLIWQHMTENRPTRAFVWQDGKLTEILPPKPKEANEIISFSAMAINNLGVVVGTLDRGVYNESEANYLWTYDAYKWSSGSGLQRLTNDQTFEPIGINDKGEVLGKSSVDDDIYIGILDAKGFHPMAVAGEDRYGTGLNDRGMVAGFDHDKALSRTVSFKVLPGSQQPVYYRMPPFAVNPDPSVKASNRVMGISNTGWAAGLIDTRATGDPLKDRLAVAWSPENNANVIGVGMRANSVNDQGKVVGSQYEKRPGASRAVIKTRAFVYDAQKKALTFLDTLLPKGSPQIVDAISINNKGEILCTGSGNWYLLKPSK